MSGGGGAGRAAGAVAEDSVDAGGFVCEVGSSGNGARGGDGGDGDGGDGGGGGGVGDVWAEGETQETKVSPGGLDLSGQSPLPA